MSLAQPADGTAVLNSSGSFSYLAHSGFLGERFVQVHCHRHFWAHRLGNRDRGCIDDWLHDADPERRTGRHAWMGAQRRMVRRGLRRLAPVGRCRPQLCVRDRPGERRGSRWLRPHGSCESELAGPNGALASDGADIWVSGNDSTFQGDFSTVTELDTSSPQSYGTVWSYWSAEEAGGWPTATGLCG